MVHTCLHIAQTNCTIYLTLSEFSKILTNSLDQNKCLMVLTSIQVSIPAYNPVLSDLNKRHLPEGIVTTQSQLVL